MKKLFAIFFILILMMSLLTTVAFGAENGVWRVLHEGAVFYQDALLTKEGQKLPRYAVVEIVSEENLVVKAEYMGAIGYILKSNLYFTKEVFGTQEEEKKVTTSEFGKEVPLQKYPYADSPVLRNLKDGERVMTKVGGVAYAGYTEVTVGDLHGFIANDNLTKGLTMNGIIAVSVGVVTGVLVILVLILLGYSKRVKNQKKRQTEQLIKEAREYGEQS